MRNYVIDNFVIIKKAQAKKAIAITTKHESDLPSVSSEVMFDEVMLYLNW